MIQQCLLIIKGDDVKSTLKAGQYALVTVGKLENIDVVLEESSDFEQIDRICQSAVFFEGIDATTPNLKRMRAFDLMLKRNEISPVFIDMDERTALIAGNHMAAFMYARFGRASTNALIAGHETLRRLGVEKEFTLELKRVIPPDFFAGGLREPLAAIEASKIVEGINQ